MLVLLICSVFSFLAPIWLEIIQNREAPLTCSLHPVCSSLDGAPLSVRASVGRDPAFTDIWMEFSQNPILFPSRIPPFLSWLTLTLDFRAQLLTFWWHPEAESSCFSKIQSYLLSYKPRSNKHTHLSLGPYWRLQKWPTNFNTQGFSTKSPKASILVGLLSDSQDTTKQQCNKVIGYCIERIANSQLDVGKSSHPHSHMDLANSTFLVHYLPFPNTFE